MHFVEALLDLPRQKFKNLWLHLGRFFFFFFFSAA
jgi:hypothetical protein